MHSRILLLVATGIVIFAFTCTAGCSQSPTQAPPAGIHAVAFNDSLGNRVTLAHPAARIVTNNGDAVEILLAIGARDRIVGVADYTIKKPGVAGRIPRAVSIGNWQNPSVEQIASLHPDVMITYGTRLKNHEQLVAANITIIPLNCYRVSHLPEDIRAMGNLTGRIPDAEKLAGFIDRSLTLIESRLATLPADQHPKVYVESYSDYAVEGSTSGGTELMALLHADNIGASMPGLSQKVSTEWIIEEDPEIVFKFVSTENFKKGNLSVIGESIAQREGFNRIQAIRNGRVYVVNGDLINSPRGAAGVLYIAKAIYPERFSDIDPDEVLREYADTFQPGADGVETFFPPLVQIEGKDDTGNQLSVK